jgi:hypothetical protein
MDGTRNALDEETKKIIGWSRSSAVGRQNRLKPPDQGLFSDEIIISKYIPHSSCLSPSFLSRHSFVIPSILHTTQPTPFAAHTTTVP